MSSFSVAAIGLTSAYNRFDRASQRLVQSTSSASGPDPVAATDMVEAKFQVAAVTGVLRIQNQMTKALLDITV